MHYTLSCVPLNGAIICSRICHLHCIEVFEDTWEGNNIKAASVCARAQMCVWNEGLVIHGQLGPDKCHLKQNTFKWWLSAHNKWCTYWFITTGLVSTVPFRYINFVCEKCHCLGHQLIMLLVSSIALHSWIFSTDYRLCFCYPHNFKPCIDATHYSFSLAAAGQWHATETLTLVTVSYEFKNY